MLSTTSLKKKISSSAAAVAWLLVVTASAAQQPERIYIVSHGWHTGLVVPIGAVTREICPALEAFAGWDHVEIGWGDEGFYRGGNSISLGVALKALATPSPTVLHMVGARVPVEEFFADCAVVSIDLDASSFRKLMQFIGETFEMDAADKPIDLGQGIYGDSRFFRARGSYYFPKTCNVWTVEALRAAGLAVVPAAGIRAENVMDQAAKHGKPLRSHPKRSRLSVVLAAIFAVVVAVGLKGKKNLVLFAWITLVLAALVLAGVTMAGINRIEHPDWLPGIATWACWAAIAFVATVHVRSLRARFAWRHVVLTAIAGLVVAAGLSPL